MCVEILSHCRRNHKILVDVTSAMQHLVTGHHIIKSVHIVHVSEGGMKNKTEKGF